MRKVQEVWQFWVSQVFRIEFVGLLVVEFSGLDLEKIVGLFDGEESWDGGRVESQDIASDFYKLHYTKNFDVA